MSRCLIDEAAPASALVIAKDDAVGIRDTRDGASAIITEPVAHYLAIFIARSASNPDAAKFIPQTNRAHIPWSMQFTKKTELKTVLKKTKRLPH